MHTLVIRVVTLYFVLADFEWNGCIDNRVQNAEGIQPKTTSRIKYDHNNREHKAGEQERNTYSKLKAHRGYFQGGPSKGTR